MRIGDVVIHADYTAAQVFLISVKKIATIAG